MKPVRVTSQKQLARLEREAIRLQQMANRRFGFSIILLWKNPLSLLGLLLVLSFLLVAVIGPYISPYDPDATNARIKLQPPGTAHFFGTDRYGRDVFSRVLVAARIDFLIAVGSVGLAFAIGSFIGTLAGYIGGVVDSLFMRFMDVLQAFPPFVLGMGLAAALGPGVKNLIIVIAVIMVPGFARMVRSQVIKLREVPFIDAAKCCGVPNSRILLNYLLPNAIGPVVVTAALNISYAMLDAAGLSFIGLGVRPPQAEWGVMISEGMNNLLAGKWWAIVFPGLALFASVLGFNLLADAIRDILDPRMRR